MRPRSPCLAAHAVRVDSPAATARPSGARAHRLARCDAAAVTWLREIIATQTSPAPP